MLSSGAMTNRIDKLERKQLIQRKPDPADRRGVLVCLTAQGKKLTSKAIEAHLANCARILDPLSTKDQQLLANLLKKLLLTFE
ncbi:MarR family winged helix-turn-helix transcriptional regulator [Aliikangiella maris]|uniref:MarR family transcriptional regulator n=2 Tax=Aliikangiella maris TaxID=3162458 RepID=A0ABV3MRV8_9GAMM